MNRMRITVVVAMLMGLVAVTGCEKKEKAAAIEKTEGLPNFALLDPAGIKHTRDELLKGGLVMVVTAPTLSQGKAQKGWSAFLEKSKPKASHLVFLEDESTSAFKGMAEKEMKKEYKVGDPIILLLDKEGSLRSKLGLEKGKTVVLVYDDDGKLLYSNKGNPSEAGAHTIWSKLK